MAKTIGLVVKEEVKLPKEEIKEEVKKDLPKK